MISVIVPVYNVEMYLDKCVQSILHQTYKDFELILVDDGSTDNSGQICEAYKNIDERIVVIHKRNGGLSDARNVGTQRARGSHITYVDSDDYVSTGYLATLQRLLERYNAELSVTGIQQFYDGEDPKIKEAKIHERVYSGLDALEKMLYQDELDTSACAMLISKGIAKSISFPIGKYHEDDFTTYKYYLKAKRVAVSNETQYFYRQRKGSIMHSFGKASKDELEAADNLVVYCENNLPHLLNAANSKKFSDYCQVLLSDDHIRNSQPEEFETILKYLNRRKYKTIIDRKTRAKNKIAAICLLFGYGFLRLANKAKRRIG